MKQLVDNAWLLPLGNSNAILLQDGAELTLVDAGFPNKEKVVFDAIAKLGRQPSDLKHLVFTHSHPDHIGSAAAIVKATDARTYMHALDAPLAESGGPFRAMTPGRGIIPRLVFHLLWDPKERMAPVKIDQLVADGDTLPVAGGLRAIHVPGHDAGQLAYLWQGGRLLIAGDVFMNIFGLGDPVGFEDEAAGRNSQRKLAGLNIDKVVFGHGSPILTGAPAKIRKKVG